MKLWAGREKQMNKQIKETQKQIQASGKVMAYKKTFL